MKSIILASSLMFLAMLPAVAGEDIIFDALTDEMSRSIKGLHLKEYAAPYFIGYTITEFDSVKIGSSLGADATPRHGRYRYFLPEVRVGSFALDNSNFGPNKDSYFSSGSFINVDDDYSSTRRTAWLQTDDAYKKAVEVLESKKAYLSENKIAHRLPDFSAAPPVVSVDAVARLACDSQKWTKAVVRLSEVFKKYPRLQTSRVSFVATQASRWFVDSEGTRLRESKPTYGLIFWARAQAADGTPVFDTEVVISNDEKQLPDDDRLESIAERLAKRVCDVSLAPQGSDYCGPVLFEDQAAAELVKQLLKPNLSSAEEAIHPDTSERIPGNPFKDMLGRRILPKYMNLVDDPLATEFQGVPLVGGYKFDNEGVRAQTVPLVEKGLLKAFCQSRTPIRSSSISNGHAWQDRSSASILELTSSKTMSPSELRQKLIEMGKDEGLKYVLVVRRMETAYDLNEGCPPEDASHHDFPTHTLAPTSPVEVYRVNVEDGKEELLSGLEFRYVTLRSFRDIQAAGDDAKPYLVQPPGQPVRSLVTPSFIVGELELSSRHPEHETPPKLPSPLVDSN